MFANGKIIGTNATYADYSTGQTERGRADYIMSRGALVEFAANPRKWRLGGQGDSPSKEKSWGSLVDCLALTPQLFDDRFAVCPTHYPVAATSKEPATEKPWNRNANYCRSWEDEHQKLGKEVVKASDAALATEAVERLMKEPSIGEYIACSAKQVHARADWQDKESGISVPVRVLLDLVSDERHEEYSGTLADLKTTNDATMRAWQAHVYNFDLHTQAALYLDVFNAAYGGAKRDFYQGFYHIVQESEWPFEPFLRLLSCEFMDLGRERYQSALRLYCQCVANDDWPSPDELMRREGKLVLTEPEPWMQLRKADWLYVRPAVQQTETQNSQPTSEFITP
jgi:hypothetical protein